jgi:SAM-dependent methyltransferase
MKPNLACRFCGSSEVHAKTLVRGTLEVFRCSGCDADFVVGAADAAKPEAAPAMQSTENLYADFAAGQRSARHWDDYLACAVKRLEWQKRLAFPDQPYSALRFLDIGCGGGHIVAAAKKLGFQRAVGTEVDLPAVQFARSKDLSVYHGPWPVVEVAQQKFDFISAMHVLEHVSEPQHFLAACLECLSDKGILAIDVPDQGSFPSAFKRLLHFLGRRPKDFGYIQPPWHVFAYRVSSFELFARRNGLAFLWKRRTSPLDVSVFPHTPEYWSGRFRWNRRLYSLAQWTGRCGYMTLGLRKT